MTLLKNDYFNIMRTITENFKIIVERQKQMGYFFPNVLRPPASIEEIRSIEEKLRIRFNDELIELYSFADGIDVPEIACGLLGLVPIHGRCYWVDLNEGTRHYGKIYYCNSYFSEPDYAFESLTTMFQTIAECYEHGAFYLEPEGYLAENDKWYDLAKKNNPSLIPYWDSWLS